MSQFVPQSQPTLITAHLLTLYSLLLCLVLIHRGREASKNNTEEMARKPGQTRYKAVLEMKMKNVCIEYKESTCSH